MKTYQIMTDNGLHVAQVEAASFCGALMKLAEMKGFRNWETYRDAMRIASVKFDGNFRITLK